MKVSRRVGRLLGALSLVAALVLPTGSAAAQQLPPVEKLDKEQAESESAPLFASHDVLPMELWVDLEFLKDERPDEDEVAGLLRFEGPEGRWIDAAAEVRTRGIFRRESRNCSFPPLRLDVPKGDMKGTVLQEQDKIKLVFPCRTGRDSYQILVLREYLAYRMLNLLTPVSFRVRLVDLTIRDTAGEEDPVRQTGFLIESEELLAWRNRAVVSEWERFFPEGMDTQQAATVSLFQFMIGNTDWSSVEMHNTRLLWDDQGRYLTVPYDFDFAGIVDAPYASPDPQFPIRSVTERIYRGFCWEGVDYDAMNVRFTELRPDFERLVMELPGFNDGDRNDALNYLELFYRVLESEGRYRREVVEACRRMPG